MAFGSRWSALEIRLISNTLGTRADGNPPFFSIAEWTFSKRAHGMLKGNYENETTMVEHPSLAHCHCGRDDFGASPGRPGHYQPSSDAMETVHQCRRQHRCL